MSDQPRSEPEVPTHEGADARRALPPLPVDAGWLFLMAGIVLLAAVVLIPAHDDLAEARWRRDQAQAALEHRRARLGNYADYLQAVERGDRAVVLDLAASQLNLAPRDHVPVPLAGDGPRFSASVFPALEPAAIDMPRLTRADTLLRRLTTDRAHRLWLAAGGACCILFGLLPPARGRGRARIEDFDDEAGEPSGAERLAAAAS